MKFSRFLTGSCCAALLALATALPAVSHAQTKLRIQSTFPAKGTFADGGRLWAERVNALSGGRLVIEMLAPGSVVPAFESLEAVHKKVLDGAHSAPAYWVGKNRAATLFGPAPGGPFGMDEIDYMGWIYEAWGLELYRELYQGELKMNVVAFPMTAVGHQAMGWFKTPVQNWADLNGRKCRQTGITAEVFSKSGMATVNMPGGEILAAGERGVINCAEWVGPGDDSIVGFDTIWKHFYPQSVHEPATVVEIIINGDVWKSLAPDLQAIIQSASIEATVRSLSQRNRADAAALSEMPKRGVTVHRTPDDILKKLLESWDEIAKEEAAKSPFFKKVIDSQSNWASQVVPTRRVTTPPYNYSANHYWPEKK